MRGELPALLSQHSLQANNLMLVPCCQYSELFLIIAGTRQVWRLVALQEASGVVWLRLIAGPA
jgi:hypothetical protein